MYGLLPERWLRSYMELEKYGFIILFVLLWGGALDRLIYPIADTLLRFFLGKL